MIADHHAIMPGHEQAWAQWDSAMAGERMHHAWLLAGPKGVGKAAFAMAAARHLVTGRDAQPSDGYHPDILVLERLPATADEEKKREEGKAYQLKRNIAIDQIRAMQQRLNTRPTLGARRAIIIDAADDLEKSAANALLKSLEEPPAGSFFLLVAHNPGRLLPTIRSRCRLVRFPGLSDEQIDRILADRAPQATADARAAALAAANGSPGTAIAFLAHDLGGVYVAMQTIMRQGDAAFALRSQLADMIGPRPDRERMRAVIDLARAVTARALPGSSRQTMPTLIDAHEAFNRLGREAPLYNYDPGLLALEIGALLVNAAGPREPGHD